MSQEGTIDPIISADWSALDRLLSFSEPHPFLSLARIVSPGRHRDSQHARLMTMPQISQELSNVLSKIGTPKSLYSRSSVWVDVVPATQETLLVQS